MGCNISFSSPQKLEHFIASFNALMEHTAHVEQQLHLDQEAADVETAEEFLGRHMQIQDQLKKAPQNTIREGNELLRALEQVGSAGHPLSSSICSITAVKLNVQCTCKSGQT